MGPPEKLFAAAALLLTASFVNAEPEPLWEAGVGVAAITFPDYRGSAEYQVYPMPLPYLVYRGQFLKADRDGVRGELFDREYAKLSISVNGSVPVDSDDNPARRGMPDLKPTLEIGPSLDLHLWRSTTQAIGLDLILPLRAPMTIESSPRSIGWVFAPRINVDVRNVGGYTGWNLGVGAGPLFADENYHAYFYAVAPRHATAERPAYEARSGYSGAHLLLSLSKRFPDYWLGAYVRADSLHGAAFRDSPLVARQYSWSGGIGIARMIGRSERTVAD